MSDKVFEKLGDKGKESIQKETRERVGQVAKELVEKFDRLGFRKEDVVPAIKKGISDAAKDEVK